MTNTTRLVQTWRPDRAIAAAALVLAISAVGTGARCEEPSSDAVRFLGEIHRGDDLSAIAAVGRFLAIASDEGAKVQILEPGEPPGTYRPKGDPIALLRGDPEVDIEAMAFADGFLYVLGSHSLKRKLTDPDREYLDNRARLATVSPEPHRKKLFRIPVDERSGVPTTPITSISLERVLERDPVLGPFTRIPAVENGVNIEGLAVDDRTLVLGFRSPVLREGYVPVMLTRFDKPGDYQLRFLQLHGAGLRSLTRVADGFLLIAVPERASAGESAIYLWNGLDQVPGSGVRRGRLQRLLELSSPRGGVPEGLAVLAEHADYYEALLVHDGIPGGHPLRIRIPRPRVN